MPTRIDYSDFSEGALEKLILSLCDKSEAPDDMPQSAESFMANRCSFDDFRSKLVAILYKVGAVGVKPAKNDAVYFSFGSSYVLRPEDLKAGVRLSVIPMLWRALGNERIRRKGDIIVN